MMNCCICLEKIPNTYPKTSCGHLIHFQCLRQYEKKLGNNLLRKPIPCPLCRTPINIYPQTRSADRWTNNYIKIAMLCDKIKKLQNKADRVILAAKTLDIIWDMRTIIRRQKKTVGIIKHRAKDIHLKDLKLFLKNGQISIEQYRKINEIVNNIRNL